MSSSPGTGRYELRSNSRRNSPEKETTQPIQESQSEDSDTDSLDGSSDNSGQQVKGEESSASDSGADETDAATDLCISDRASTAVDRSKSAEPKSQNRMIHEESCRKKHVERLDSQGKESKYNSCLWQLIILIVPVTLLAYKMFGSARSHNQNAQYVERPVVYRLGNLTSELEHIKAKYTSLDDNFWDVIAGSSWSHIQGDGTFKRPVVLLLVGPPKSSNLDAVASDVAKLFSNVFTLHEDSMLHIDGSWQAMKESDQAKLDMDNLLKNGFQNGRKVVLVTQFDKLPPCSIMLFHSYCDNENAPHKDAVIIFTVELQMISSSEAQGVEELVQEHLATRWAQCPEELLQDKIMAMHSRVSNNIAFVK